MIPTSFVAEAEAALAEVGVKLDEAGIARHFQSQSFAGVLSSSEGFVLDETSPVAEAVRTALRDINFPIVVLA